MKLLYQKKGGKDKVLAKTQAWFEKRYRPRVQRLFRRLLAEEGHKEEAATMAETSSQFVDDLETAVQPLCCWGAGCWDGAEGPTHLAQKDLEMTAAREPGRPDDAPVNGGDAEADADADADADAESDMAEISEAVARAVERSAAAKGIAQVQAAWRGTKERRREARVQKAASTVQAVHRGSSPPRVSRTIRPKGNRSRRGTVSSESGRGNTADQADPAGAHAWL